MSEIKGWQNHRLDKIGELYSGATPSTANSSFWGGDIVWITPSDLSELNTAYLHDSKKKITEKGYNACSAHLLPPNSITISSRAPIGYVALPQVEFCTNQGCKSILLSDAFDPEFTYHNVRFHINKLKNLGEGTTFAEISKAALATIELPFPHNRKEQTQIAAILSTIDKAIEQTEAIIAKQQRIKTGLMQDLLTRGIDEAGNIRSEATHEFKDSPLGRIPVEWEVRSISNFAESIVDCPHTTPNFQESGILVARTFNIKSGCFGGEYSYVSEEEYHERIQRLEPMPDDIVFTREAPVGEAFVIPEKMKVCLGQRTMLIRCMKAVALPDFFVHQIYSEEMRVRFDRMVGGTTNPHLNVADVRSLLFKCPKIPEQTEILQTLKNAQTIITQNESVRRKYVQQKTGLMQDLLTGKVRVTDLLTPSNN